MLEVERMPIAGKDNAELEAKERRQKLNNNRKKWKVNQLIKIADKLKNRKISKEACTHGYKNNSAYIKYREKRTKIR